LTVNGVIEQKNPTHAPCISLPIKRVFILGINTKIPAKIATELQMTKFLLNKHEYTFENTFK